MPNHQVGRITPLKTRFAVASSGNLGYELDLNKLNDEEKEEIKKQVAWYKQYRDVIQKGTFYRIKSPFDGNDISWNFISEDENTVICYFHQVLVEPIYRNLILKWITRRCFI